MACTDSSKFSILVVDTKFYTIETMNYQENYQMEDTYGS